jgi:CRP/FNR family transcriptional regulator, cyclic AMP receptor protein
MQQPLFAALQEPRLREIAECCPARRVRPGAVVARQGDRAESLIVVLCGQLSAGHHSITGGRVQLVPAVAPCVLGKAVVLSGQRHQVTWTARTQCLVRVMAGRFFRYLLAAEPGVRDHALRYLSGQVMRVRQERIDRDTTDTPARVAGWLAGQCVRHGPLVPLPAGQQGMAEELGLSRVTVNRALQSLMRSGVVSIHCGAVQVLDADALFAATTSE